MTVEQWIGIVLVVCSMGSIITLALWARRIIQRIAERGCGTAREAIKELAGE